MLRYHLQHYRTPLIITHRYQSHYTVSYTTAVACCSRECWNQVMLITSVCYELYGFLFTLCLCCVNIVQFVCVH